MTPPRKLSPEKALHTRREALQQTARIIIGSTVAASCKAKELPASAPLYQRIAARAAQLPSRRLRVLHPKGSLGNITPIVQEFHRLTKTKVELIEASLDEISAEMILASRIRNRSFDVAIPATFGIADLVEGGAIAALDDFARKYEPPSLMKRSIYTLGDRYQNRLYGYQTDGDAYVMFYNRDWIQERAAQYSDRYGAKLQAPKTWRELDQQLEFFHAPEKGRFGGSLFRTRRYAGWEFWIRLHAKGLFPVSDQMEPRFNREESHRALQEMIDATKFLDPKVHRDNLFENFASFGQGNKFANIGWGGTQKYLNGPKSKLRNRMVHGVVPGGMLKNQPVHMPYFNWGWNYVVSSKSTHPELAYLFILFASTPHISTLSVREVSGYFDPFRTEHYEDEVIQKAYGRSFLEAHRQSLEACIPDFYLRGQGRYFAALRQAVHIAISGQLPPEKALQKLDEHWRKTTEALGSEKQIKQWSFLKKSYPSKLRSLLE